MSKLGESGFQKFVEKTLAKFTSKTKQFNTGTETDEGRTLSISGGTQFVRCNFEPKIVKLYHNTNDGGDNARYYNCLVLWLENGETIYSSDLGRLAGTIETTSDGFYFNAPGASVDFNLRWEAYA